MFLGSYYQVIYRNSEESGHKDFDDYGDADAYYHELAASKKYYYLSLDEIRRNNVYEWHKKVS